MWVTVARCAAQRWDGQRLGLLLGARLAELRARMSSHDSTRPFSMSSTPGFDRFPLARGRQDFQRLLQSDQVLGNHDHRDGLPVLCAGYSIVCAFDLVDDLGEVVAVPGQNGHEAIIARTSRSNGPLSPWLTSVGRLRIDDDPGRDGFAVL